MNDDTQAAAPAAEAPATPVAEVASAQDTTPDLDTLLKEFETQAAPQTAPAPAVQAPDPDVKALAAKVAQLEFQRDFEPLLNKVRGDVPKEVLTDKELGKLIDAWAEDDPALQRAWLNRNANPKAWAKVESALSDRVAGKFKPRIDVNATADKEAVAAAVRGASTTQAPADPPKNYGTMNDAEFRKELAKFGI